MILSLSPGALLPVPNLHGCAPSSISLGTVRKFLFSLPRVLVSQRPVLGRALRLALAGPRVDILPTPVEGGVDNKITSGVKPNNLMFIE